MPHRRREIKRAILDEIQYLPPTAQRLIAAYIWLIVLWAWTQNRLTVFQKKTLD